MSGGPRVQGDGALLEGRPMVEETVWGLDAREIHDAYWASMGVACVRLGSGERPDRGADVYLLLGADDLVVFDMREISEALLWSGADLTRIQVIDPSHTGYRERIVFTESGTVARIERRYRGERHVSGQVLLAQRYSDADAWRRAGHPGEALGAIRATRRVRIGSIDCKGVGFDGADAEARRGAILAIARVWARPDRVIEGIRSFGSGVFGLAHDDLRIGEPGTMPGTTHGTERSRSRCVGPLWIGARSERGQMDRIGPDIVWDTTHRGSVRVRRIDEIFSPEFARSTREPMHAGDWYGPLKRAFDFVVSATALLVLSPLIALIALMVFLDDGRPIFFGHRRQSLGGRNFRCWKFRTMRRNAEALVAELRKQNLCDGPQVFIKDDPRVTRVGRVLRKIQLDELPQLWNVLLGEMSIVGPRPSPDNENQFCPAWREKRLSVRPGITGLWQVMRTRAPGKDFQEWIQYDIEYVDRRGPWLDLKIMVLTALGMVGVGRRSAEAQPGEPAQRNQ